MVGSLRVACNASNMNRPEDGARFEPLIGNPGDGSSPHCAVVDEYHEHATDALYTTMLTGMGARRQPLMWAITTAGYNIEGPCYDKRREVIEMLNGSVPNDELFGIIYTVDEGDDWTDPQVLEKANPNIGVSVYREFLLSQQQRAKNNARLANVFKTKHLNIWVSARSAYFNLVSWQSCEDKSLTLEQFEGQPCILAFDLARKLDMNSMARLYTREITEDLGKITFRPSITAYVVGDDCFDQRDRLIDALNKPGPGTLVHPTYGELKVCVDGEVRVSTSKSEGRIVRFDLKFVEAGELSYPTSGGWRRRPFVTMPVRSAPVLPDAV